MTKTRRRQTHSSKDTREHNGKIENIQQVSSRSSIFILLQQFFGTFSAIFWAEPRAMARVARGVHPPLPTANLDISRIF